MYFLLKADTETLATARPTAAAEPTPNSPNPALKYGLEARDRNISVSAIPSLSLNHKCQSINNHILFNIFTCSQAAQLITSVVTPFQ